MDILEMLKKHGLELSEDKVKDFNTEFRKSYKHENELNTVKSDLETTKSQLNEANKQIQSFKDLDVDSIKKVADEWKTKAEQAEAEAQDNIKKLKLDYALNERLIKEGAVNTTAVKALLKRDAISLDGDNLIGVDEQLKELKETEKWAFNSQSVGGSGGNPPPKPDDKPKRPTGTVIL